MKAPAPTRADLARHAVAQWSDALDRHDVGALNALYADRVMFYGRDAARSAVLAAKGAALGRGSTFRQSIVGTIAVEGTGDTLSATFTKRSGRAGKTADVHAKLVFTFDRDTPRIAAESDENTDRTRANARRPNCESVADRVVRALPEVAREVAEADRAAAATDGKARPGGIGPIEEEDGSFRMGIGIHTDERFEAMVWYDVDSRGQLSVTTMAEPDLRLPRAAIEQVERACSGE